ncbi:class I SAM-dependent methyltransferase [Nonlabens marinus]|uniref:SAM-dependent methyltransferases n=1 Tax=Nonlabens marinus S1-08 TaxID=1454201 RepID=W8VUS0_9FLAO|nr:class I SAM-dependent methyltransferase [Nonlabens marinus]BAO54843.1 SAM-dependent methyltransferases [Nonlabens marinus S1-08]
MIKESDLFIETKDFFLTQENFTIHKTSVPGVLKTIPQPEDLSPYYETTDYLSHDDSDPSIFARLYRLARKWNIKSKYKLISTYADDGSILDVGAGNGELVRYLKEHHLDAQGYEPSKLARDVAYRKGVNLLDHLPTSKSNYYQVIQMFHVLEHIPNPESILQDLHKMLVEDGVLIIALPNYKSWDAQFFKRFWAGYDVPRHLFHFEEQGVRNLVKDHFELIKTRPMWLDSFYVSILSCRYKKWPIPTVLGMGLGLVSNIYAIFTSQPSSRIYILKKHN